MYNSDCWGSGGRGDSPHGSAELLIRHIRVLFAHAPHARDLLGADDAEDALASVLPANQ